MVINVDFLHHLDRLSLIINKKITSNFMGDRTSTFIGKGSVFRDRTFYAPGEDFRSIDWKAYARTNKLYIKKYEEERNLTVHIIIDFSASMKFGGKLSKADYASMIGIGFSYMALKNNEKFVLSTFSDKLEQFRPRKGRKQLARIIKYLNEKKPAGTSQFEKSLSNYKKLVNSKSLVVIISDCLYSPAEIESVLSRFTAHEIKLVQVLDAVERDLSNMRGDFKLKDAETSTVITTFIGPFLKKSYHQKLEAHNNKIREICDRTGARFYSITTDTPIFDAFYTMLKK